MSRVKLKRFFKTRKPFTGTKHELNLLLMSNISRLNILMCYSRLENTEDTLTLKPSLDQNRVRKKDSFRERWFWSVISPCVCIDFSDLKSGNLCVYTYPSSQMLSYAVMALLQNVVMFISITEDYLQGTLFGLLFFAVCTTILFCLFSFLVIKNLFFRV